MIIKNDKNPGFSFVHKSQVSAMESIVTSANFYTPVDYRYLNIASLKKQCSGLGRRIAKHHDNPKIASSINKSLAGRWFARMGYTCKTHKTDGDVSLRPLHKGINQCFEGLSRWFVWVLTPWIDKISSQSGLWSGVLAKDSFHFRSLTHGQSFPEGGRMHTLDLKDFFLSGSAVEIAGDITS